MAKQTARRDAKPSAKPARDAQAKQRKGGSEERYTVDQVIEAIRASSGIISLAAQKLRCSRQTVYDYKNKYPAIVAACEETEEETLDLAEAVLKKQIQAENMTAVIFYLKTKGKKRGYTERVEASGPNGGPIPVEFNADDARRNIFSKLQRIAEAQAARKVA